MNPTYLAGYASSGLDVEARLLIRRETLTHVVEIIDGFILATFLLIFGLGLYEHFIGNE